MVLKRFKIGPAEVVWSEYLYQKALGLINDQKYPEATEVLNRLIANRPFNSAFYAKRAICHENTGRRAEELLDLYYSSTKCRPYLCQVRDFEGRPPKFRAWIEQLVGLSRDGSLSRYQNATVLGGLALASGNEDLTTESLATFAECSREPGYERCSMTGTAELKLSAGLTRELEFDCKKQIAAGVDDPLFGILLARVQELRGKSMTAAEHKELKHAVEQYVVALPKKPNRRTNYPYYLDNDESLEECLQDLPKLLPPTNFPDRDNRLSSEKQAN